MRAIGARAQRFVGDGRRSWGAGLPSVSFVGTSNFAEGSRLFGISDPRKGDAARSKPRGIVRSGQTETRPVDGIGEAPYRQGTVSHALVRA